MMDTLAYDALVEMRAFPELIPPLKGTATVLGRRYNLPQDKGDMNKDIQSRLWCTYRKNFRAISGTSLTTDTGWGCTLRCGQMLMAQTLLCLHLGREWRWTPKEDIHNPTYMRILRKFLDIRDSEYSLQMIALQGADFGRPVGNWFGPNNVAQAIRKLSVHDAFSKLAVHVAMDMVVVEEDLKALCRERHRIPGHVNVTTEDQVPVDPRTRAQTHDVESTAHKRRAESDNPPARRQLSASNILPLRKAAASTALSRQQSAGQNSRLRHTAVKQNTIEELKAVKELHDQSYNMKSKKFRAKSPIQFTKVDADDYPEGEEEDVPVNQAGSETPEASYGAGVDDDGEDSGFRPLLLFIPLRLGQETFNQEYSDSLKACLSLPQSVGFIGGKPRHALYFIGYHGDHLLYLDPHTTQQTINLTDPSRIPDASYHCTQADRMNISELDPSIALGFFCKNESDIDDLCSRLRERVVKTGMYTMFELTEKRPLYWEPLNKESFHSIREPFLLVDGNDDDQADQGGGGPLLYTSDEEFEIIEWPPGPLVTCSTPQGSTPHSSKRQH